MVDFNELNADIDENNKRVAEEQEKTRQLESGELIGEDNTFQQKDPSEFGLQENIQELFNAGAGAVRDEVSSVLTAPERIFDMFSGEMEEQGADYKPDWDPLGDFNPQTKTKWGNMLRGALGYAAFAIPVGGVAKSIGLAGKAAKGLGLAGKGGRLGVLQESQADRLFVHGVLHRQEDVRRGEGPTPGWFHCEESAGIAGEHRGGRLHL